jgi:hypothetical protein
MNSCSFALYLRAFIASAIILGYEFIAERHGWPVGGLFRLRRPSWLAFLALINEIGVVILSAVTDAWRSALLLILIGIVVGLFTTVAVGLHTQRLSLAMHFTTAFLFSLVRP